ncbi:MAG: exosortase H-associated membrane protein [Xanthomonadales bacterium]|nr:exosortase H-associated membrane protein [Xanthomonadales bacterium]
MTRNDEPMRLGELLLLACLWMLFGFMLWYYLSAFHGVPVRLAADQLLRGTLGESFFNVVPNPDRHYLFQVQTRIPFRFPDGTVESLGFIINPLVYGYGLPLLFGLVMAAQAPLWRKLVTLLIGYLAVMAVQIWGVYWQALKMLSFNFGDSVRQVVLDAGVSETAIALCYQLGVLIFPPLVPVIIWVLANWREVERFTGWKPPRRN